MFAAPQVETEGLKKGYGKVIDSLARLPKNAAHIWVNDIGVIEPSNRLVKLLRSAVSTGPGISGIRFTRNAVSGQFIEDAHIYRMT